MSNITLITDSDMGYEWLYVDSKQIATGEPIDASTWLDVMIKYQPFATTERLELTEEFIERVDGNLRLVPKNLVDFQEGDLI